MTTMVALLRGLNVGAAARLRMADLREIVADCGYDEVRTYVQSGNVVLVSPGHDAATVADTLRQAIAGRAGIEPDVVVRTRDELAAIVAANPYPDLAATPTHLHVVFMPDGVEASTSDVDVAAFAPEHATAAGRELYLSLPGGIGRSPLATALDRARRSVGTTRNWRTVTALLDLADDTAAETG